MNKKKKVGKSLISSSPKGMYTWLQSGLILVGFAFGLLSATIAVLYAADAAYKEANLPETGQSVSNKDECEQKGGRYNTSTEECVLATEDYQSECSKNSDCEGFCLANDGAELGKKAKGYCSREFTMSGCFKFIDEGIVNSICID